MSGIQLTQPLRFKGVKSDWLSTLPDSGTEMLTISSTGVVSRQAIPSASFGALTGLPSDNAALQSALDDKLGGSTGGTDNRILRADGTGGSTVQNSAVTIDDSGNISGLGTVGCGAITASGNVNLRNNDTLRWDSGNATILFDGTGLQLNRSATQYVMYGNQHHLTGNFVKIGGSTNPAPDYRLQVHGDIAVRDSGNIQLFNAFASTTNFESLRQQWASNEARIGTAVGSAGGTQRNMVLGSWNAADTWVPAMSIRPTNPAYPVKFHGSSGIWVGDQTTYEGGRIWSSVNAWGIANASSSYGTGAMNLTGWNGNTLQLQGGMQNTTNLSFAIDTDNNDPTSAFYFLAGVDNSGNPATNGLVKFEKSGNVGIGTMSPSARLHVNGSIMGSTKLLFSGTTGSDYGVINATGTRLIFGRNSTSDSIITVGMNPTAGQAGLTFRRGEGILWSGSTTSSEGGGVTAGVLSPSADLVEINNGTAGQTRDLSCRVITSGMQTLVADPSTVDITAGLNRIVKNSTSGEVRHWVNDGGTMKSVLFT